MGRPPKTKESFQDWEENFEEPPKEEKKEDDDEDEWDLNQKDEEW